MDDQGASDRTSGALPRWRVAGKLTASRCRPGAAGWVGHGLRNLAPRPWRSSAGVRHARTLPDRAEQRRRRDGSAGGLGLVLVDALHHAALHIQGVVEQLALAVGGVPDQLGEQRLLT